ncbi:CRTAC1 family protein [Nonomuraea sp. SYSU D8015]|uniref:CRTAC1 family protein n=1 Tax=Nonomuraea sp. SYSU D8015 TaxID=2593644 RepID=UPI00166025F4|nr:CRTAC1 family protein [Nonomuraea sp. SYSU D8015]
MSPDRMERVRPYVARGLALLLVVAAFLVTRLPEAGAEERQRLGERYRFAALPIAMPQGLPQQTIRQVHPDYRRIQAWMSSVGAGIAMTDLDGDGLANDLCYVDPRVDRAVVAPAPVGPARYQPFALDVGSLRYDAAMAPMGCLPLDANADGRMDLLVYYWGRTPTLHLATGRTPSPGTYRATDLVPGSTERWNTNAASTADVDGDGRLDLIIGNYFPDDTAVLDAAGQGPVWMNHSWSRAFNAGRNRLFLGTGDTSLFKDASKAFTWEMSDGWTLALGAQDLDGDLLPEIYMANDMGPDRLLHNRSKPGAPAFALAEGARTLTTPGSKRFGHDSFKGMATDFGDINRDGHLDIVVSNITEEFALQESNFVWVNTGQAQGLARGQAPFTDRSEEYGLSRTGWGWDARMADLDNDGIVEVLQATGFVRGAVNRWPEVQELALMNDEVLADPDRWPLLGPGTDLAGDGGVKFFAKTGEGARYSEISGLVGMGESTISRGIALGDADGDGDLDVAVANQWAAPVFYRNDSPTARSNASLTLSLARPAEHGTTPLIGATVTVRDQRGARHVAQSDGGSGHSGKRSPEVSFGLGPDPGPLAVEIGWRDENGRPHRQSLTLTPGRTAVLLTDRAVPSPTGMRSS